MIYNKTLTHLLHIDSGMQAYSSISPASKENLGLY